MGPIPMKRLTFIIIAINNWQLLGCSSQLRVVGHSVGQVPAEEEPLKREESAADQEGSSATCQDPVLDRIPADVQIELCDGSLVFGSFPLCSKGVQTGCLTTPSYPAVHLRADSKTKIMPQFIVNGQTGLLENCSESSSSTCKTNERFKSYVSKSISSEKIRSGRSIAGVEGKLDPACSAPNQIDCVSSEQFPAVMSSRLVPINIAKNASVSGVVGSMPIVRRCRNSANLNRLDAMAASNLTFTVPRASVDVTLNKITLVGPHGMTTGFSLRFAGSPLPLPLAAGTQYFAIVDPAFPKEFRLAATETDAFAEITIDIIDQGSDAQTVRPYGDGEVGFWDLIDDHNNGAASHPSNLFWSQTEHCGPENFEKLASSPGITPTGTILTHANVAWTEIWQDLTTGVKFTNILNNGLGSSRQFNFVQLCQSLDSGDGAGKWYLPTQKEMLRLYINGISRVPLSAMSYSSYWSSTQVRVYPGNSWSMYPFNGATASNLRSVTTNGAFCVRY